MPQNKAQEMKKIEDELFSLDSPLVQERRENKALPVIGEGNLNSQIVFIGEAPGKKEAQTGKPFCGASGKLLDSLLEEINLDREDIYITNIVKDRPTDNRDPKSEEINQYASLLDRQLEIIKPKVITTLGRFSMKYIMQKFNLEEKIEEISKIHGKIFKTNSSWGQVHIIPLYHPAVAIYNRKQLPTLQKDFKILSKFK